MAIARVIPLNMKPCAGAITHRYSSPRKPARVPAGDARQTSYYDPEYTIRGGPRRPSFLELDFAAPLLENERIPPVHEVSMQCDVVGGGVADLLRDLSAHGALCGHD
jgi:hypothetical protein